MLTLKRRKGSPYFHITGTYLRVRVRETTKTTDRQVAEKALRAKLKEIEEGEFSGKTFADAIEAYIDNGGEDKYLARINEVLGKHALKAINQESIDKAAREAYNTFRRTPNGRDYKHKASTIKRQFYDPVASVLHYAHRLGWVSYVRVSKPKVTLPPPEWAEADYFEKIWEFCDQEVKTLTMFLCLTGCRISECLSLEWKNVDLINKKAFIPRTKTKAYRTVHLPDKLVENLKSIKSVKSAKYVFSLNYDNLRWRLKKASKAAGVPYMASHKIGSHTFATWMRRYAGLDARGLKDTGRWASIQTTERYTHTDVSESSRKSDALADILK